MFEYLLSDKSIHNCFSFFEIISEEKDSIDRNQLNSFKDRFQIDDQLISSPSIHDQKQFLTVPLSSVAVWIDPLDATKEFTGLFHLHFFDFNQSIENRFQKVYLNM